MKYFIDTEFLEGTQYKTIFGIKYGKTKPTIDLISIGIVAEDGREYYAISKDFNLKEAWNRYDLKINKHFPQGSKYNKEYWIRDNVLFSIWKELVAKDVQWYKDMWRKVPTYTGAYNPKDHYFNYSNLKRLINDYGKTNKQIAEEVKEFVYKNNKPEFYGYYSDYDWVVFCWLFGKMIDLPKEFPQYCIDLKQELDNKVETYFAQRDDDYILNVYGYEGVLNKVKQLPDYPKQINEHHALADAKWNKELYDFFDFY